MAFDFLREIFHRPKSNVVQSTGKMRRPQNVFLIKCLPSTHPKKKENNFMSIFLFLKKKEKQKTKQIEINFDVCHVRVGSATFCWTDPSARHLSMCFVLKNNTKFKQKKKNV